MRNYLSAIGFKGVWSAPESKLWSLLSSTSKNPTRDRQFPLLDTGEIRRIAYRSFDGNTGLVQGGYLTHDRFRRVFYFPYVIGSTLTKCEKCEIYPRHDGFSVLGVWDYPAFGCTAIFQMANIWDCMSRLPLSGRTLKPNGVRFSGLAASGMILIPMEKSEDDRKFQKKYLETMKKDEEAWARGDFAASNRVLRQNEISGRASMHMMGRDDVYSIVDTFFLPEGFESDTYQILGDITAARQVQNDISGEKVWILDVSVCATTITVAVNVSDLRGEPAIHRRFRGNIWLQGAIEL
jgi:hypothetical protein